MTRLEFERRRRGWTQTVLAFHAGVTPSLVSLVECRRMKPTPTCAARLGQPLGLSGDAVLDEVTA